jgi:hypothetical protein
MFGLVSQDVCEVLRDIIRFSFIQLLRAVLCCKKL